MFFLIAKVTDPSAGVNLTELESKLKGIRFPDMATEEQKTLISKTTFFVNYKHCRLRSSTHFGDLSLGQKLHLRIPASL